MRPACSPVTRTTEASGTRPSSGRRGRGRAGRRGAAGDEEPAAAGVVLAHQREAARRFVVVRNEDVLQQVAEVRLDGALVPALDLEVVGERPELADAGRLVGQQEAGRVAVLGAGRLELLERRQPRLDAGQFLLAGAGVLATLLVLRRGASASSACRASPSARTRSSAAWASASCRRPGLELGLQPRVLDVDVRPLGLEPRQLLLDPLRARRRRSRWRAAAS